MTRQLETLAIIPARGGSKGLPRKNVLQLAGEPLICHTINHALLSHSVTRTVVSTDDEEIAEVARQAGAELIDRPPSLASDTASSEDALLHVLEVLEKSNYCPDLVVFLQCTSPIRSINDIDRAVQLLIEKNWDSLFSACLSHNFLWRMEEGQAFPVNYDFRNRQPRQLLPREYQENGSIYVCRTEVLTKYRNRLGGKVGIYEMPQASSFEIDTEFDFFIIEQLMKAQ